MQTSIHVFDGDWDFILDNSLDSQNTLVIIFGPSRLNGLKETLQEIIDSFPNSFIIGASSAGEIVQDELKENTLVVTIAKFNDTVLKKTSLPIKVAADSFSIGEQLAKNLCTEQLPKSVFVLSDGLNVNGSQLTKGLNHIFKGDVIVTGGLAGDNADFEETWVIANDQAQQHYVTAIAFYGESICVSHSSKGGWDRLGIARKVTRSQDNVLYELDGRSALEIYKQYLGNKAKDLPASGLLFPLQISEPGSLDQTKVRTILSVNEDEGSITFAGDIPQDSRAWLMKANFDRLIDGANSTAEKITLHPMSGENALCIAISCIGRRLVLKQRTEEELEVIVEQLADNTRQVGFYSYGEISTISNGSCDLQNQTMTLTLIWEKNAPTS